MMKETNNKMPACKDCVSRTHSVFKNADVSLLQELSMNKYCNFYKNGQEIFLEGNYPAGLYCIHHGKVKESKQDVHGRRQIVRLAGDGDMLGHRALLSDAVYPVTATALEDSMICMIPREFIVNLIKQNPCVAMNVMGYLACHYNAIESRLINLSHKPVMERLCEALLMLKKVYGEDKDGSLAVHVSRRDLAEMTGTTTETIIRNLSEMKKQGHITLHGRKIKILRPEKLLQLARVTD